MRSPQTLMVFVDGLGLGSDDPAINPLHRGDCPCLERLLRERAVPLDACLGVPGMPQSATGQATLLTGQNAAALMGRHMESRPGPRLQELVREHNLFSQLLGRGYRCTFANAYFVDDVGEVLKRRRPSVTTVAALRAFGSVRDTSMMLANRAVYQDLTREFLRDRGYTGPAVSPAEAAQHLAGIASEHDFTLFEYFMTDVMAHKGTDEDIRRVLAKLDEFVNGLHSFSDEPGRLFLLTSDHGNIEDSSTRLHTLNPVPLVAVGDGAEHLLTMVKSLADVVPALLEMYPPKSEAPNLEPGT